MLVNKSKNQVNAASQPSDQSTTSADDIAISVKNLTKTYRIFGHPGDRIKQALTFGRVRFHREFIALQDASFEIKKGETVGIIGRNGSGKSTLLQLICGILKPTSGEVQINGRISALLELGSGFNPDFTGRENIYFQGAVIGFTQQQMNGRLDDIIAFADIGDFIDQPVRTYSSGMFVRLAFAVAINVDPQILIVDEALSVGDEMFQRKCFSRIETMRNNGATILLVSHSSTMIIELCDQVILLDTGEMLAMGYPKLIASNYQQLINAPQEKNKAIRDEIRESSRKLQRTEGSCMQQTTTQTPENEHVTEIDQDEFFDPDLSPQSKLEYASHGARIEHPEILTSAGQKVNYLKRGKSYRYRYKVKFDHSAADVRFGMLIKSLSGLELGGAISCHSAAQGISRVSAGTLIRVEFSFTCNLNPGTFFLNAGVTGRQGEDEVYLHRVLDICMFKVMPVSGNTATAIVDFNCVAEHAIIEIAEPGTAAT